MDEVASHDTELRLGTVVILGLLICAPQLFCVKQISTPQDPISCPYLCIQELWHVRQVECEQCPVSGAVGNVCTTATLAWA